MKLIEGPVDMPVKATFLTGMVKRRREVTVQYLVSQLGRPFELLPRMSNTMRAIIYFWTQLTSGGAPPTVGEAVAPSGERVPAGKVLTGLSQMAVLLGATAEVTERLSLEDRMRLMKLKPEDVAPAAAIAAAGLGTAIDAAKFSGPFMREFMLYALHGAAPNFTQLTVLGNIVSMLRLELDVTLALDSQAGQAAFVRLLELIAFEISSTTPPAAAEALSLKTEDAMRQRVINLRAVAATFAAIPKAAWLDITNHHKRFIAHPWVQHAAHSRNADELERAVYEFDSRSISYTGFSEWPELAQAGVFDMDIIGMDDPPTVPDAQTSEPQHAGSMQHTLAGDLAIINSFVPSALPIWTDRMWAAGAGTEHADSTMREILAGNAYTGTTVPTVNAAPLDGGEFGLQCLSTTSGYPLVSTSDPTAIWVGGRWAERAMDVPIRHHHTLAFLRERMFARTSVIPVTVGTAGPYTGTSASTRPTLIPVFHDLSDVGLRGEPNSLDFLTRVWGLTIRELRELIKSMPAATDSMALRNLAEACRFVGLLRMQKPTATLLNGAHDMFLTADIPVDPESDVVPPFERHYYHSTAKTGSALSDTGLLLGNCGDRKEQAAIILQPFTHLPSTSMWQEAHRHMKILPHGAQLTRHSAARWITEGALNKIGSCSISGWTTEATVNEVWDIIGIHATDPRRPDNEILLLMGMDETRPMFGRRRNAVVSMLPLGMPGYSGPLGDTPAPAIRF